MTQAILNPVKLPSDLNPAEKKFAACLANGEPCSFLKDLNAPVVPEEGTPENTIRSEVVRFFAYGGKGEHLVRGESINLWGAWISGDLGLMYANIPYVLVLTHCHFADSVVMPYAECAALNLSGSYLVKGLVANGLTTKGDVNLCAGFSADDEVRLLGANIGGNLSCAGGRFHNLKGCALNADGLTTKGGVNLRDGFSADGEVRLLGANIGEDLNCTDGRFHSPNGHALAADEMTTGGSVHLHAGFSADGEVSLFGASIGGNLGCAGGKFHNPDGCALTADGLATKSSVYLRKGFAAKGEVWLLGASVGRDLDCTGGKFINPKGRALTAQSAKIDGVLIWQKIKEGKGLVYLAYAKAGFLADDLDSWKPFKVVLDGFTYDRFFRPANAQSRIDWLGNRPANMSFSPLPYEQAAKVLFGMGHAGDARKILLEKEREVTKRKKWWQRPLRWLWDEFAGYGYRLWRTVAWSLAAVVVGWGVFSHASDIGGIVPHQPAILASDEYQQARQGGFAEMESVREKFSEYPEFNPLVFSADVFIPLFALHQEPFWYPVGGSENILALLAASQHALALAVGGALLALWMFMALEVELRSWPRLAMRWKRLPRQSCSLVLRAVVVLSFYLLGLESPRHWYWLEIGAGWILTSLFLLSVTGFLRPRQSSGEKG